jgi:hypothetical protein
MPDELTSSDEQNVDVDRRGPQQQSPADREAGHNPANRQNLEKPAEGRDVPPEEPVEQGKRDLDSPWMGGG